MSNALPNSRISLLCITFSPATSDPEARPRVMLPSNATLRFAQVRGQTACDRRARSLGAFLFAVLVGYGVFNGITECKLQENNELT